ncbi:MAG TPA: hypothetical protein VJY34_18020 [Roseiarcus sp.]|nr:hypothetical protein [Roseiarcus sp.]
MQRRAGCRLQFRRGLDNRKSGSRSVFSVVLVRQRVAEIGEHAVAHVLGDEAAVAFDQARAAFVIGGDDPAHVLGIEPGRYRGRADEIAEHHGQLPALGGVLRRRLRLGGRWVRDRLVGVKLTNRTQQFSAIAEDDAEFLQVLVGKLGKDGEVNAILGETLGVIGHA